ncbi:MAG TPA: hypothetical protein VLI71_11820 [Gammaproteobacteria bacterium]|nr:hypothetical protein [Gammaproteobacteria bacterium]
MRRTVYLGAAVLVALAAAHVAPAQPRPAGAAQAPRSAAPVDLTGYWVAVVTEDWRHRMATARKGDFESLPLNAEGRRVANEWDLAADNAAGLQCKAFGVGGIMRQPGRLHITWADDDTLQIEFDAGTQTRLLEFAAANAPGGEPTWQGFSRAEWQRPPGGNANPVRAQIGNSSGPIAPGGGGRGQRGGPPPSTSLTEGGALKVSTTGFRAGYLRKNGVPYSENARITEYFHRLPDTGSGDWLHVLTIVEDPRYLNDAFLTSTHFKREPNGSKWNPTECRTAPPPPPAG